MLATNDIAGQLAWLERDEGRVPCSRYGYDSASCAPWAVGMMMIYIDANGAIEGTVEDFLDWAMGLVVNDHDDPLELVTEHGGTLDGTSLAYLREEAADLTEMEE